MTEHATSDDHFGHYNIIGYSGRPYQDVHHMHKGLVDGWNNAVDPGDTVYILGDIAMGDPEHTLKVLDRCHGYKVLFPGNHDRVHKMYSHKSTYDRWIKIYLEHVDDIVFDLDYVHDGMYRFNHFPHTDRSPDHRGRDYSRWESPDDGKILFCGHVHEAWQTKLSPKGTPMVNVGVDVWNYAPVSLDTLKQTARQLSLI